MKLPTKVTVAVAKAVLQAKKNSPHLFFGAGLGGVGLGTFLACKGTLKVEPVLDNIRMNVEEIKQEDHETELSRGDKKLLTKVYIHGTVDIAKLYAPAIIVGGVGVAALTGAHVQLTRRNTALAGSLAATIKAWNEYRVRVADEVGKDKELDIYRGLENKTIKNEDGTKEVVKVRKDGQMALSPYAKCFDEQSIHWKRNADMNRSFVTIQQEIANHDLKAKGYVFLNDVYKALGFEPTAAGQNVGWYLNGSGDGYVDFGLHEVRNEPFVDGYERSAWLDFNVDGVITDKLEEF